MARCIASAAMVFKLLQKTYQNNLLKPSAPSARLFVSFASLLSISLNRLHIHLCAMSMCCFCSCFMLLTLEIDGICLCADRRRFLVIDCAVCGETKSVLEPGAVYVRETILSTLCRQVCSKPGALCDLIILVERAFADHDAYSHGLWWWSSGKRGIFCFWYCLACVVGTRDTYTMRDSLPAWA